METTLQRTSLKRTWLCWGMLLGTVGCVPAPVQHQTKVLPASELKITMNKSGRAEVTTTKAQEAPAEEGDAGDETPADSEK